MPAAPGHDYNLSAPGEFSTGELRNFQSAETGEFSTGTDTVTLPAYLGDLRAPKGARVNSRGVMERWTSTEDSIAWNFKVNHPGAFDVELVTSQQKDGNGWDGGQHVALDVASQQLAKIVVEDGKEINPANPYWPYVITNMGRIRVEKAGSYAASIKADSIPDGQKFGLTLVSVRLVPAK